LKLKSSKLISKIFHNWYAKVICLLASLFIFIFYRISTQQEVEVMLNEVKLPDGYSLAAEWPQKIQVAVRGGDREEKLKSEDFKVFVDLSDFTKGGEVMGDVVLERLGAAQKLSNLEFDYRPQVIRFTLEATAEKYVLVDVPSANLGAPPRGFTLDSYTITPERVLLRGPSSLVAQVKSVSIDKINLSGVTGTISKKVSLRLPNRLLSIVDAKEVTFFGVVSEKRNTRIFSDLNVALTGLAENLTVAVIPAGSVEVEAAELVLEKMTEDQVHLAVDCSSVREPGEYMFVPVPEIPVDATLIAVQPDRLKIRFDKK